MAPLAGKILVLATLLLLLPSVVASPNAPIPQGTAACEARLETMGIDDPATGCVVAYAHAVDRFGHLYVNTEPPPATIPRLELGMMNPTVPGFWESSTFTFRMQYGHIEYQEKGLMLHPMPWSWPAMVDGLPLDARLHFTVDQTETPLTAQGPVDAGVHPCVTLELRLLKMVHESEDWQILSETSAVGHFVRPGAEPPLLECADDDSFVIHDGVTTFDLRVPAPDPAPTQADRVHIQARLYNLAPDGQRIALNGVRLVQGGDHLNHFVLANDDAIRVQNVTPTLYRDHLVVHVNVTSPWGPYDAETGTLRARILDEHGTLVVDLSDRIMAQGTYTGHLSYGQPFHAFAPLNLTTAALPDGRYTIVINATNAQGTARSTGTGEFLITGDGSHLILYSDGGAVATQHILRQTEDAPTPPGLAVVAIGAALFLARRRLM